MPAEPNKTDSAPENIEGGNTAVPEVETGTVPTPEVAIEPTAPPEADTPVVATAGTAEVASDVDAADADTELADESALVDESTEESSDAPTPQAEPAVAEPAIVDAADDRPDAKDLITEVICQTGGAKKGAETLIGNMTDDEIATVAATLSFENRLVRIADSVAYFAAMEAVNTRLSEEQKAAVEASETENKSEEPTA